jgi:filamentous hemagglutinin family protein
MLHRPMWAQHSVIEGKIMYKSSLFLSLLCTSALLANPQGAHIQSGEVSMQAVDQLLEIHAPDRSIIHWNDFSIGRGETTRFIQPSASSAVLNRVTGMSVSIINGILEANGRVILVNPQGVLIGKEGVIKTAEFIASTTDVLNLDDWSIRRDHVQLNFEGTRALINHEGMIEATGVDRSGGRILLLGPDLKIDGQLVAQAGSVELLGEHVLLSEHAAIDVSGVHGDGGVVFVGGDYQGKNPDVMNSKTVGMHPEAIIVASAGDQGNGGKVILWADEALDFRGSIFAKGGSLGGDGGFIETSSKGNGGAYKGHVDTSAIAGKTGEWLLDPCDITINAGPSAPAFTFPTYAPPGPSAVVNANDIQAALGGSNVTIQTSSGVGGLGLIDWQAGFPITWNTSNALTLNADSNITIASDLTCTGGGSIALNSTVGNIIITSGGATSSTISTNGAGSISLASAGSTQIFASTLAGGVAGLQTITGSIAVTSTAGSIIVGDALASDATTISTISGPINLTAATGVDVIGGIVTTTAKVVTGTITAPINVNVTGTGNVQLISTAPAPGLSPEAHIGDDLTPSGPVVINVANGDLNLLVGNTIVPGGSPIVKIGSQDSINIKAGNMNVLADGLGIPQALVSVATVNPTTSSIQLSGNFLAKAVGVVGQAPRFTFDFPNSTLSFSCAGNFTMTNTAFFLFIGFHQLGGLGTATFNIGGNFVMAVGQGFIPIGTLYFDSLIPLSMNVGGDFLLSSQGQTFAQFFSDSNLNLHVNGNIVTQGGNFPASTVLGVNSTGSDTLNIFAGGDIHMKRHSNILLADNGPGTVIANRNIILDSDAVITINNVVGSPSLTLVVDNQFPSAPLIGPGAFIFDAGATIFPLGTPGSYPVRIFTARRSQNSILGTINGTTFAPGAFDVNTPAEQWRVYYPQSFIGSPFTVFYKEPFFFPPLTFSRLYAVLGNMYDVLSEFEYPLPFYREAFCLYYCSDDIESASKKCWSHYPARKIFMILPNDSCYPVQELNYRKFHPYRPKTLQMDMN